ncbi:hypothetical protein [Nocardia callitridis]|uniref:WXG100 family type VII secretion target n=1 Tax=Nocardia callitridis TaxID=648753 RepID=A0ABP9KPR0_9NOCA
MPDNVPVEVDTAKLHNVAGTMINISGRVGEIVWGLKNTLNAKGYPWGHDNYGDKFTEGEEGYSTSSKNLLNGADNMVTSLAQFGNGMGDAANKMDDMDT